MRVRITISLVQCPLVDVVRNKLVLFRMQHQNWLFEPAPNSGDCLIIQVRREVVIVAPEKLSAFVKKRACSYSL